jgi:hypothetical protein
VVADGAVVCQISSPTITEFQLLEINICYWDLGDTRTYTGIYTAPL